jgi:hypothetical protein
MDSSERYHYIVGDIHGCHAELLALERRIARHASRRERTPLIVSVGDLVDRGPDSAKVVAHVRRGVEAGTHACVLGNHEEIMLLVVYEFAPQVFAAAGCRLPSYLEEIGPAHARAENAAKYLDRDDYRNFRRMMWVIQGGFQTLTSYGCDPQRPESWTIDRDDLAFLCGLPLVWECDGAVVTHGLVTREELAQVRKPLRPSKATESAMWGRSLPPTAPVEGRMHVSGHTPLPRGKRHKAQGCVQVDSGCVYGRKLTAYCVETDEFVTAGK